MRATVPENFTNENGQKIQLADEDLCDLRSAVCVAQKMGQSMG
jgi:hypothetical protein